MYRNLIGEAIEKALFFCQIFNPETQSNSSKIVEKLGTEQALREKLNGQDPYEWAKEYIKKLNQEEKEQKREVMVKYSPVKKIEKD